MGLLFLMGSAAAQADVTLCNKSSRKLQAVVAYPVSIPYLTKEISGWYIMNPGQCSTPVVGNWSVTTPFYFHIEYYDTANLYRPEGETDEYELCVIREIFVRRGSWDQLQVCPPRYYLTTFFQTHVPPEGSTLNFY